MSARNRLTSIISKTKGYSNNKPSPYADQTKWNILRGDKVQVVKSNHLDQGKQGIVLKVLRDEGRVIVEGINLAPKHIKGNPDRGIAARTIRQERSILYSAINLVDPVTNKPTRVIRKMMPDGSKARISKVSGAVIPRPEALVHRKRLVSSIPTDSCTSEADVWEVTYQIREKLTFESKQVSSSTETLS
jgi:large subunit ribosomal protein L24